jgi:hypothetical protein
VGPRLALAGFLVASLAFATAEGQGGVESDRRYLQAVQQKADSEQRRMKAAYGRLEEEQRRWAWEHFAISDPTWEKLQVRHAELVARDRRLVEEHARLCRKHRDLLSGAPPEAGRAASVSEQADMDRLASDHLRVLQEEAAMAKEHDRLAAERARHR